MPNIIEAILSVQGMSCSGCVASVTRVISAVPGAEPVHVEIGRASVTIDDAQTSPSAVCAALSRAGYDASVEAE